LNSRKQSNSSAVPRPAHETKPIISTTIAQRPYALIYIRGYCPKRSKTFQLAQTKRPLVVTRASFLKPP